MKVLPEVIVIGSGVGGAMTARRLAENGVNVLMLERGDWVPREDQNWNVASVFFEKKYTAHDSWLDASGTEFRPSIYYNVGGCTKFYGGGLTKEFKGFTAVENVSLRVKRHEGCGGDLRHYHGTCPRQCARRG